MYRRLRANTNQDVPQLPIQFITQSVEVEKALHQPNKCVLLSHTLYPQLLYTCCGTV